MERFGSREGCRDTGGFDTGDNDGLRLDDSVGDNVGSIERNCEGTIVTGTLGDLEVTLVGNMDGSSVKPLEGSRDG